MVIHNYKKCIVIISNISIKSKSHLIAVEWPQSVILIMYYMIFTDAVTCILML